MNIVRELRKKKGIQQKELAAEIGVSMPAVSNWENGKSDPSGERLQKLAEYFGVDEVTVLGKTLARNDGRTGFVAESNQAAGLSEAQQIVNYVLDKLDHSTVAEAVRPKTEEARILAKGIDRLPKEQREQALAVVRAMFEKYADYFEKGSE